MTTPPCLRYGTPVVVAPAHRDVSGETMRSFVEVGDGGYWTVHAIAWSPDGRRWASAGADDTVRVWDLTTRRQVQVYAWERERGKVLDIVWSPDGQHIALLADGVPAYQLVVIDASTGLLVYHDARLMGIELSWLPAQEGQPPSPERIAVTVYDSSRSWSSDGRYFATSHDGPPRARVDIASVPELADSQPVGWPSNAATSGRRITARTVEVVERSTARVAMTLPSGTTWIAWCPSRSYIAGAQGGSIRVWDADTHTLVAVYHGHVSWFTEVTCLSWAPSGQYLASGDSSGMIHIWQPG